MNIANFFRLSVIVSALPVTLANGTTADATQVMSDLNHIVNQVNANAADVSLVALKASNNNFTAVQSGIGAAAGANFPIASQVQNWAFNTLTSTLGTNTITARVAALSISAWAVGQVFTFIPAQQNTGSATLNPDGLGSGVIKSNGQQLVGGELGSGAAMVRVASAGAMPVLDLLNPANGQFITNSLGADVALNNTSNYFDGPSVAQGTSGTWFASGTVTVLDASLAAFEVKLWDGTTVIASALISQAAGLNGAVSLSGFITSPAGNIRISVKDQTTTAGNIKFNASGNSKDSTITAIRIR